MERTALCIGLAVLGLLLPGCGGSHSSEGVVTAAMQRTLSRQIEQQMDTALHVRHFTVTAVSCETGNRDATVCQLEGDDGHGHTGTISLAVATAGSAASAQVTGISNEEWTAKLGGRTAAGAATQTTTTPQGPLK